MRVKLPSLTSGSERVPQRGEGVDYQLNLVDNLISRRLRRIRWITSLFNYDHAGAGIHGIAPVTRCAMRGGSGENDNEDDNDDKPWFCHINQQSPIAINLLPCNY